MIESHFSRLLNTVLGTPIHEIRERGNTLRKHGLSPPAGPPRRPLRYSPEMAAKMLISIASKSKFRDAHVAIPLFYACCKSEPEYKDVTFGNVLSALIDGSLENTCREIWVCQFGKCGRIYEIDESGYDNFHYFKIEQYQPKNKTVLIDRFAILHGSIFEQLSKMEWRAE